MVSRTSEGDVQSVVWSEEGEEGEERWTVEFKKSLAFSTFYPLVPNNKKDHYKSSLSFTFPILQTRYILFTCRPFNRTEPRTKPRFSKNESKMLFLFSPLDLSAEIAFALNSYVQNTSGRTRPSPVATAELCQCLSCVGICSLVEKSWWR